MSDKEFIKSVFLLVMGDYAKHIDYTYEEVLERLECYADEHEILKKITNYDEPIISTRLAQAINEVDNHVG